MEAMVELATEEKQEILKIIKKKSRVRRVRFAGFSSFVRPILTSC